MNEPGPLPLSIFIIAKNATRKNYQGIFRIGTVPYSDPSNLEVYWQQGDTDIAGNYIAEWVIVLDGREMSVPMPEYVNIKSRPRV